MNTVEIKTNEILLKDNDQWLHFAHPEQIISVEKLEDVSLAFHEMERLIKARDWYAAGFVSYEAASAFDPALQTHDLISRLDRHSPHEQRDFAARESGFPYLWFGLYPKPYVVELPTPEQPIEILDWQPSIDRDTFNLAIAKIKDQIAAGRTYQVNYTMRMKADFTGNPWEFFLHLVQKQNKHAAYIDTPRYAICSASPELFFELDGDIITCRPMKGTTRRGRTMREDNRQAGWLKNSEKNRAENVMIVDMIRNDLGKIAEPGTVHVPELFEVERYPTLWQMTSTVTARTLRSISEIFSALFPCASITGAPKVSTMKIIAELEGTPRKIYTGSIGYVSPHRKAKFNVAIRTALIDRVKQSSEYGIGGGIVWDSTHTDEYDEALLKARILTEQSPSFSLLETLLWTPYEGYFLGEKHIARMLDSAKYFNIFITEEELEDYLKQISSNFSMPQRVRVLLNRSGELSFESRPFNLQGKSETLKVCLAQRPIDSNHVFLFHKTTERMIYESARAGCEEFDDVLLYNEAGELTEFTIGNLVVELDGQLLTPPISCAVLPGTFRAHLVATGQVLERVIPIEQLKHCRRIFRVNSLRKWQRVEVQKFPGEPQVGHK